jgi:xanthine dehydrogenase YagS FAD-binding subunit
MAGNFSYVRVKKLEQAVEQLQAEGAALHAGGTDLLGCLRDGVFDARKVVSIAGLDSLRGISENASGQLRIGALTTIAEIADNRVIQRHYPVLAQAAAEVASPPLRNQGTLGGNICQKPRCWYYRGEFLCLRKGGELCFAISGQNQYHAIFGADRCCVVHPSDTAPALVALYASAVIVGPGGRREVRLDDFFVPPSVDVRRETVLQKGEIVTEVLLPSPVNGSRSSYRKVRARGAWDFALASLALAVRFDGKRVVSARAVLGGAAPVPWRVRGLEDAIAGRELDDATIARAAEAALAGAEIRDFNAYKRPLFQGIVAEALAALAG